MKKQLYKPQADNIDVSVNVYTNESCTYNTNCQKGCHSNKVCVFDTNCQEDCHSDTVCNYVRGCGANSNQVCGN
jgi:hypothetical protein